MAELAPPPAAPCWSNIVKQQAPPSQHQTPDLAAAGDRVFLESCKSTKGIAVAVVDANAVIQGGERLSNFADKFVTVSEVMNEIRDPMSRHRLNFVPFTVDTREPSPEALKKVINFARATGDLQTLSDVDLKLIALTYTLEAQIHGTNHLRDSPPPIHTVNVRRLPEKDMPGWGSNVPNLEEWEALEQEVENKSNPNSRILPLQDLNLNVTSTNDCPSAEDGSVENEGDSHMRNQEDVDGSFRKPRRYLPKKKEISIEGKKMVADGIDASQGQFDEDAGDFQPAVSRSTRRRYIKRQARRKSETLSEKDSHQDAADDNLEHGMCRDQLAVENNDGAIGISEERGNTEGKNGEDLSIILNQMSLEEDSLGANQEGNEKGNSCEEDMVENNGSIGFEGNETDNVTEGLEHTEISSLTNESLEMSHMDDYSSEQSWMLRSLSESSVACVTSDFAMQNVLLQMGLRLLAPGGMQIRQLQRWILKCHACFKVTTEIGRIFCPSCGNGGTLRKVAVTVGENGIVLADRRLRISVRGTRFSLPLPQGGRDAIAKNPVLREDQLPQKFLYPKTKKKNKQVEDIFVSNDIFCHHTDRRAALQPPVRKALAVFSGKRNPNDNHYSRSKR